MFPPRLGNAMHRRLMKPLRRDLFSRFKYRKPLGDDAVQLTWLGTAGFAVEAQGQVLLLDPFVSRPGVRHTLARRLSSDIEAIRKYVPRADVIAVGHSHHDHALDVPDIARITGAQVIGSSSTINLCRAHGLSSNQLNEVTAPQTVEKGPFRITVRPSIHGKAIAGRIPMPGDMPQGLKPPLRLHEFKCGETFGIHVEVDVPGPDTISLFHLGSADFFPETVQGIQCDLLTPCLYGREPHHGYTRELLQALKPRVVVPNHFDDFMRPLGGPIRELPGADLVEFRSEVLDSGHACRLVILDLLGCFRLSLEDEALPPRSG